MTDPFQPSQPTQPGQPAQPGAGVPPTQPRPTDPFTTSSPTGIPGVGVGAPQLAPVGASARRRSGAATFVNVLLGVALVVAVGGVAFAAGRATAPAPVATNRNGFGGNGQFFGPNASGAPNRGGGFGGFGGAGGGVSIQGTVTAMSADSISLQLASGQTVTIPLDGQTTYHSRTAATASQVTDGATVIVQLSGVGRGAFGGNGGNGGNGNGGNGGAGQSQGADQGPAGSGAPGRTLGSASSVTIVPAGS